MKSGLYDDYSEKPSSLRAKLGLKADKKVSPEKKSQPTTVKATKKPQVTQSSKKLHFFDFFNFFTFFDFLG